MLGRAEKTPPSSGLYGGGSSARLPSHFPLFHSLLAATESISTPWNGHGQAWEEGGVITLALRSGSPFPASPNSFKLTLPGPCLGQDAQSVYSFFPPTSSNHQPHALLPPPKGTTSLRGLSSVNLRVLFSLSFLPAGKGLSAFGRPSLPPQISTEAGSRSSPAGLQ